MTTFAVELGCLLLSLLSRVDSGDVLHLLQSPSIITAAEGQQVQMRCCWQENITSVRLRVKWSKDNVPFTEHALGLKNVDQHNNLTSSSAQFSHNCSILTISNMSKNHSGFYVCEVIFEIPALKRKRGAGTRVVEHHQTNAAVKTAVPLAVALAALCFTAAFCSWRRRRPAALQQAARPGWGGLVMQEAPHGVLEGVEEMNAMGEAAEAGDRNSDSSRGSTQWRPVQLYESIDYFDVKTDDHK
ncbi:transmembrane and immunoglobulin domain-containing protein 2-like isoform X2 [Arapaima gigas]